MAIVYKYLTSDRITYFNDELLRFTQPKDLNDPYECLPSFDDEDFTRFQEQMLENTMADAAAPYANGPKWMQRKVRKALVRSDRGFHRSLKKDPDFFRKKWLDAHIENASKVIGIFSLSRRWNSAPMWAHYSNRGEGFCIGFDENSTFFQRQPKDSLDIGTLQPVIYVEHRPKAYVLDKHEELSKCFYCKHVNWEYEAEVRIVRNLENADIKKDRAGKLPLHLFKVPHGSVSELVVGVNASDATFQSVIDFGKKQKVPVSQTVVQVSEFDLGRRLISK